MQFSMKTIPVDGRLIVSPCEELNRLSDIDELHQNQRKLEGAWVCMPYNSVFNVSDPLPLFIFGQYLEGRNRLAEQQSQRHEVCINGARFRNIVQEPEILRTCMPLQPHSSRFGLILIRMREAAQCINLSSRRIEAERLLTTSQNGLGRKY
jgi:hypothetical protein